MTINHGYRTTPPDGLCNLTTKQLTCSNATIYYDAEKEAMKPTESCLRFTMYWQTCRRWDKLALMLELCIEEPSALALYDKLT